MTAYVRRATIADAVEIAPLLRTADKAEILASTGMTADVVLPFSVGMSTGKVYAMCGSDDLVGGLFGVRPVKDHPELGLIWMVITDRYLANRKDKITFIRQTREWLNEFHGDFPVLGNYIHAANDLHIKWIKWMGFKLIQRHEKWGAMGEPFYKFIRIQDV